MNRFFKNLSAMFTQSRKSRSSRSERGSHRTRPEVETLEGRVVPAVHFRFIPVGDTAIAFFDKNTADGRMHQDALDAAKEKIERRLVNQTLTADTVPADQSLPLDPLTGGNTTDTLARFFPNGLTLQDSEFPVLVGVHGLPNKFSIGAWSLASNHVRGTSFTGGVPLLGALSFFNNPNWSFDTRTEAANNDFVATAEHELVHVLGFTKKFAPWAAHAQAAGGFAQAYFTGADSMAVYQQMGGVIDATHPGVPLDLKTPGHWAPWRGEYEAAGQPAHDNQGVIGFFENANGAAIRSGEQEINSPRITELEFAALRDIGWNVTRDVPPPGEGPDTGTGQAGQQTVIVGLERPLLDKIANPDMYPPERLPQRDSATATLLVNRELRTYVASRDNNDGKVYITVDTNPRFALNEETEATPSLAVLNGRLFIAWTGTDDHIYVAQLAINPTTGAVTGEVPGTQARLGYTTDGGVGLEGFRGALFMSFVCEDWT